jgi:hypothetical protein
VRFGDTQVGQQKGYRLGTHRTVAIGVQRELPACNVLFQATFLDQPLGQLRDFAHGHHPAGDVAAEHIEDHVEVEVGPLSGPQQFGMSQLSELIGSRGQQLRLFV